VHKYTTVSRSRYLTHYITPLKHKDEFLDKTLDFRKAQADFLRVKQENARLRFEIEKHKLEEERYNKMQLEIQHLTSKLNKMEQSRPVYEDASNHLGSFFELFSNQLALSPYGTGSSSSSIGPAHFSTVRRKCQLV
jgi:predicted RNase H-like nuclease (RuvC/YqgF family)